MTIDDARDLAFNPDSERPTIAAVPARPPLRRLSRHERQVASLLAAGMNYERITTTLGIAPDQAARHVASILAKLGVLPSGDTTDRS